MSSQDYKVSLAYHADQGLGWLDDETHLVPTTRAVCDPAGDRWNGQHLAGVQKAEWLPAAENRWGCPGSIEGARFQSGQKLGSTVRAPKTLDAAHGALRAGCPRSLGLYFPR